MVAKKIRSVVYIMVEFETARVINHSRWLALVSN